MELEMRRATLPDEAALLAELDSEMFTASDAYNARLWATSGYEIFILNLNDKPAGSLALAKDIDATDPGMLYLVSIGVLPEFQNKGLGSLLMAWTVAYARLGGFGSVKSHHRKSNTASYRLHEKFNFKKVREVPGYYRHPEEPAVLMRLDLNG